MCSNHLRKMCTRIYFSYLVGIFVSMITKQSTNSILFLLSSLVILTWTELTCLNASTFLAWSLVQYRPQIWTSGSVVPLKEFLHVEIGHNQWHWWSCGTTVHLSSNLNKWWGNRGPAGYTLLHSEIWLLSGWSCFLDGFCCFWCGYTSKKRTTQEFKCWTYLAKSMEFSVWCGVSNKRSWTRCLFCWWWMMDWLLLDVICGTMINYFVSFKFWLVCCDLFAGRWWIFLYGVRWSAAAQ